MTLQADHSPAPSAPDGLELRYHPKADRRTAIVMASAFVPWTLYFMLVDTPAMWWAWPILIGVCVVVAVWAHIRLLRRRPVALVISDEGLVHHGRDGHTTWTFPWADIVSVEFEERLVEGPILVFELTEKALARHWNDRISMNRVAASDLGGHHHIGANITPDPIRFGSTAETPTPPLPMASSPIRRRAPRLTAGLVFLLAACEGPADTPPPSAPSDGVSFAVFGDQPYADRDVEMFPGLVAEVNRAGVPVVIHVGDIKAGGDACTDEMIVGRRELYRGFDVPMVFTPGDNEWTDCHGAGGDPLERLAFLRTAFFVGPEALPLPDGAVSQADAGADADGVAASDAETPHSEFVENVRWVQEDVLFATAHVVGSANAREAWEGRTPADDAEVERREAAVREWVEQTFAEARRIGAAAVVIAAHADLRFNAAARGEQAAPFRHFLEPLEAGVLGFEGPVLLLQGDTHSCLFDQPRFSPDRDAPGNFRRLRVPGGAGQTGWLLVTLRPGTDSPISVTPRMLRGGCRL